MTSYSFIIKYYDTQANAAADSTTGLLKTDAPLPINNYQYDYLIQPPVCPGTTTYVANWIVELSDAAQPVPQNVLTINQSYILEYDPTTNNTFITTINLYPQNPCPAPPNNPPNLQSGVCFPAGTKVITGCGPIAIEKLNPGVHTIRGMPIRHITETVSPEDSIVCIEPGALYKDGPREKLLVSLEHHVLYKNKMIKAADLVNGQTIYTVPYDGRTLYNVLLAEHSLMVLDCGLIVETLNPEAPIAKFYNETNYSDLSIVEKYEAAARYFPQLCEV